MGNVLRAHADQIVKEAIAAVQPDAAVRRALAGEAYPGRVLLVAAGKAAWRMAKAASDCLGDRIERGVVITKYGHVMGPIARCECFEAGHPVPDENSFRGTQAALNLMAGLTARDTVLFLLSGGGSALFEKPLVSAEELRDITGQLLACGAWRSTPSASGCLRSRAGGSRSCASRRRCRPSCCPTCLATRWI